MNYSSFALSYSYDGSVYNKGSSTNENKVNWCVNRSHFAGRRVKEGEEEEEEEVAEEDGENRGLTDFRIERKIRQLPKKAYKCLARAVSYVWRPRHVRAIPT